MISSLVSLLKDKFARLNPREQILLSLFAAVFSFLFIDLVLVRRLDAYRLRLEGRINTQVLELRELQKVIRDKRLGIRPFSGRNSEMVSLILGAAEKNKLARHSLRQKEGSRQLMVITFKLHGSIKNILGFIVEIENMNYLISFRKMEISFDSGENYRVEGELVIQKG